MKLIGKSLTALVIIYAVLTVVLFAWMKQPPDRFAWGMSKIPMITMMVLPFKPDRHFAGRFPS
jgi:hypothetical protein